MGAIKLRGARRKRLEGNGAALQGIGDGWEGADCGASERADPSMDGDIGASLPSACEKSLAAGNGSGSRRRRSRLGRVPCDLLPLALLFLLPATLSLEETGPGERLLRHRRPLSTTTATQAALRRNSTAVVGGGISGGDGTGGGGGGGGAEGDKQAPEAWEYLTKPPTSPSDMQWLPVVGGGEGIELQATSTIGELITFTVSNCSRIARGVSLPSWAMPPDSAMHTLESGAQELCSACGAGVEVAASLYPAKKDGDAVAATYENCTDGKHSFSFRLASIGIWNLRVTMGGQPAVASPIIRAEEPENEDEDDPLSDLLDLAPAPPTVSLASQALYAIMPPGFMGGVVQGKQGMVQVQTAGWNVSRLGVAGTNGTLCGLDLGLKLLRGGGEIGRLRSNWTLLACRGLGPDVARPGRTRVYGGFGLTKSNMSSASLSCTEVRDEAGRCEVYFIAYTVFEWGDTRSVDLLLDGHSIGISSQMLVFPPLRDPWYNASTLVASRDDWQYMDELEFSLIPRNAAGERIDNCDAPVAAFVRRVAASGAKSSAPGGARRSGSRGRRVESDAEVEIECDVETHATYTLTIEAGIADGSYLLYASMGGKDVLHVPLAFTVRPGVSAKNSKLSGPGLSGAVAGIAADVYLELVMHNGLAATDCSTPVYLIAVEKKLVSSTDDVQQEVPVRNASGVALHKSYSGELEQCSGGMYHLKYTVMEAGNYSVSVLIGKHRNMVGGGALDVEVVPGRLSSQHCGVVGDKLGSGSFVFGSTCRFMLYLRDSYGNYISCEHYYRDLKTRNISEISVYHETEGLSSWTTKATIGRCSDRVYKEAGGFSSKDGVLDVEFQLPSSLGEEAGGKEIVLDLEVRINGKRLKQGPYSTAIRPARLNPGMCQVMGIGTKGAEPGQDQVLSMQLVNELGDNMTTCGSMALTVGLEKCGALLSKAACTLRSDCAWTPLPPDSGACSPQEERELVEVYIMPLLADAGDEELEKMSGRVMACDRGRYELSYSLKEPGRYSLHVLVGGKEVSGSPFHVVVAAGCRSGAVEWPCLGRGLCLPGGKCECTAGYLGKSCQLECPGMDDDGQFCSGRGNCTLKPSQVTELLVGETVAEGFGQCSCAYGFIGRLCHLECPGGAGNVCNGNGLCLEDGTCQCLGGYGGERCQFKNREIVKFGSMSAIIIITAMLVATVVLVSGVVIKQRARARKLGYYDMVYMGDEGDVLEMQPEMDASMVDRCADGVLDCVESLHATAGVPTRRANKSHSSDSSGEEKVMASPLDTSDLD